MVEFSESWGEIGTDWPRVPAHDSTEARWSQFQEAGKRCPDPEIAEFTDRLRDCEPAARLLDAVFCHSPFLSHILIGDLDFTRSLLAEGPDALMARQFALVQDKSSLGKEKRPELMSRLRGAKARFVASAALADITGCRGVMALAEQLSRLACECLEASAAALLRELHERGKLSLPFPDAPTTGSGLILLGMGKLAASELNFSSDIDIIVLFDEDVAEVEFGAGQQVFSRFARNLVELMARRTADGYVFRTDLRLRPDPASTPPAISVNAALAYYRTIGQTWERAAMIKARPVAGDIDAGERFIAANSGFIWRRNLDFAAVRDIQAIKRQINANKGGHGLAVEGHNVKLGRGGIREIEFLAQTQQLIWGGQEPALRGNRTLDTLAKLAGLGHITVQASRELSDAYRFLRRIEHRIQMVDDQQTHSLPSDAKVVDGMAAFLGCESGDAFRDEFIRTLKIVESHYGETFADRVPAPAEFQIGFDAELPHDRDLHALTAGGFRDSALVWRTVNRWVTGQTLATRGERASRVIGEIAPRLLSAFARTSDPDAALARFDRFLGRVARSIGLLEMLSAKPELCELVGGIFSEAPRLSDWLGKDPGLLESVLENEFADLQLPEDLGLEEHMAEAARRGLVRVYYKLEFSREELTAELNAILKSQASGFQDHLDIQRRWARRKMFQIGVHMQRGLMAPTESSVPLCSIAESCLETLLPAVRENFSARHGSVEGGQLAIIACGKLGSCEMTLASDLDLIFVYDHPAVSQGSDGEKPLSPTHYFARLCRRFLNGVTAPTAEGKLFDVDMRLRPSGKSGPIACSLERFVGYQRNDAWTWEHQALTRARVIYAEGHLQACLDDAIREVLCKDRDRAKLASDIRSMRERMRNEFDSQSGNSIKHRRGGMLDAEFIAQYLQLAHAARHPDILMRDAHSVFVKAGELGIIDPDDARSLAEDAVFWRNLQGQLLLATGDGQPEPELESMLIDGSVAGQPSLLTDSLKDSVEDTADRVAALFDQLLPRAS